jgi:hypothetical protein
MHVYKRELVESQGSQLKLPAGETNQCWAIGFPPEGQITRMILRQSAGSSVALTVNLLDRNVCDVGSGLSVSLESADPMTRDMAKIIPTQSVSAGDTLELRQHDPTHGGPWSYRNREGTFTVPVRAVYLHIAVSANNDGKEFELALECEVGNESN